MSISTKLLVAVFTLASTPCLALTTTPPPPTHQDRSRFGDPDEALAATGSSFRDAAIDGRLRAQDQTNFYGTGAPYGSSVQLFNFGPLTGASQVYGRPTPGYGGPIGAPGFLGSPVLPRRR